MKEQLEYVKCNFCGNDNYKIIFKNKYNEESQKDLKVKFRSSGDETLIDQVVKCRDCGLEYINPRIKSDLIIEGYSEGDDPTFASQAKGRERTFEKNLNNVESLFKRMKKSFPGKVLDIGTANGSFLHVAKKKGWEVYGIEPNKWLCEWAKKHYDITVQPGTLDSHKFETGFFDMITLWDVLEHVPDPKALLKECNRILKKGGVLVINYPDAGSLPAKMMGRKWVFYLSVHLYYFNKNTIKKMLESAGYSIKVSKPHFQSLELGYLVFRSKAYSKLAHRIGEFFVKLTHTEHLKIWYWVGQTMVLAVKE